ncbi:MAG: NAD(P)H-dependent glycerol-3-phosphate dehydrogenase [Lentisphaeria bacterium]|nr:NAD(P)H-dependent glycerol-3-phosphate dehydrogenase [Lentisphaeria bacterium]
MSKHKITVISDGGWGTAIALTLLDNQQDVTLWGMFPEYIEEMKTAKENFKFLKGIPLPDSLKFSSDIKSAIEESDIIILATPSQFMRNSLELIKPLKYQDKIFIDLAKGIEVGTLKRMSEVVEEVLGDVTYVALSGPSHAEEVAKKLPTTVCASSTDLEAAKVVQSIFNNDYFRVYTNDDVIGAELGGALKNIFAIAAGIIDGMGLGDNTKAALMTRGIVELSRLGIALGGKEKTFSGLTGLGDLIVTCTSQHSRNRFVGEQLGKGKTLDEIIEGMGMVVAEGVKTTQSTYFLAKKLGVDTPIVNEIYAGLYEDKSPTQGIKDLMNRSPKAE